VFGAQVVPHQPVLDQLLRMGQRDAGGRLEAGAVSLGPCSRE
jgi:hypothetical protein